MVQLLNLQDNPLPLESAAISSVHVVAQKDEFRVKLDNFEGPFDLLLSLISKHELDITEVSLSKVTDEFIAFLHLFDSDFELDRASDFLVVAATLLDLKVVGLLPRGELVDAEDVALLEVRDLLFSRLLQYRAFKYAAKWFDHKMTVESLRHPRLVRLEEQFRQREPELLWTHSAADIAALAILALAPRNIPTVGLDHLHTSWVSLREQTAHIIATLRRGETITFRQLIAGIDSRPVIVARFLAILELYRHGAIGFEQLEPLGELTLRWAAENWSEMNLENLGADYEY